MSAVYLALSVSQFVSSPAWWWLPAAAPVCTHNPSAGSQQRKTFCLQLLWTGVRHLEVFTLLYVVHYNFSRSPPSFVRFQSKQTRQQLVWPMGFCPWVQPPRQIRNLPPSWSLDLPSLVSAGSAEYLFKFERSFSRRAAVVFVWT